MLEIRIYRLIKCLFAAGCAAVIAASADSGGDGGSLLLPAFAGYSIFTMWVYLGFRPFAAMYAYIWAWSSIMGMLGSLGAIVTLIVVTMACLAAGIFVIPLIFVLTLLGIIFNSD